MHTILIAIIAVILGIVIFFTWANYQAKKQHAAFSKEDVVSAINNALSGKMHDDWDLFLSWPIRDPYLESVRQRCRSISEKYSGTEPGKDIGTPGEQELKIILGELNGRA